MKPLEINQEQKDKLIEMTKVLFPDKYRGVDSYIYSNGIINMWDRYEDGTFEPIMIHWFEFTMTYLSEKILSKEKDYFESKSTDLDIFRGHWKYWEHPIDYLYIEFKKLEI